MPVKEVVCEVALVEAGLGQIMEMEMVGCRVLVYRV